jgi:hypothetical protein
MFKPEAHIVGARMVKITRVRLTPLDAMFTGTSIAYTPGATTGAAIQTARQGELSAVGSVD